MVQAAAVLHVPSVAARSAVGGGGGLAPPVIAMAQPEPQSEAPRITPAPGPPLWDTCDAPTGEGVDVVPDWDLAAQPGPDYQVNQRVSWWQDFTALGGGPERVYPPKSFGGWPGCQSMPSGDQCPECATFGRTQRMPYPVSCGRICYPVSDLLTLSFQNHFQ